MLGHHGRPAQCFFDAQTQRLLLAFTAGLETRESAHLHSAPNAAP